jgi:hypothetical protein
MRALDAILCVVLVVVNLLGLSIWWWLFGTPIVRLWGWYQRRHKHE